MLRRLTPDWLKISPCVVVVLFLSCRVLCRVLCVRVRDLFLFLQQQPCFIGRPLRPFASSHPHAPMLRRLTPDWLKISLRAFGARAVLPPCAQLLWCELYVMVNPKSCSSGRPVRSFASCDSFANATSANPWLAQDLLHQNNHAPRPTWLISYTNIPCSTGWSLRTVSRPDSFANATSSHSRLAENLVRAEARRRSRPCLRLGARDVGVHAGGGQVGDSAYSLGAAATGAFGALAHGAWRYTDIWIDG